MRCAKIASPTLGQHLAGLWAMCTASRNAALERTRPGLSAERVQLNAADQVDLQLKTPWRNGTTQLVISPLEFMQRLAVSVPWL